MVVAGSSDLLIAVSFLFTLCRVLSSTCCCSSSKLSSESSIFAAIRPLGRKISSSTSSPYSCSKFFFRVRVDGGSESSWSGWLSELQESVAGDWFVKADISGAVQALRDRAKPYAGYGHFELYKTSIKFDNPEARLAHDFPLDMEQVEVKQLVLGVQNTGRPYPQVSDSPGV